jgi:hypothetical protein
MLQIKILILPNQIKLIPYLIFFAQEVRYFLYVTCEDHYFNLSLKSLSQISKASKPSAVLATFPVQLSSP